MKRMLVLLFTGILVIGIASLAFAVEKATPQIKAESDNPGVIMTNVIGVEATVEAVDYDQRTATLKRTEVETITIKVDKAAKNFDQVKVGDQVIAEYIELVAIFVPQPNEPATAEGMNRLQVALKNKRPDGIAVKTTEITATVEAIDYHNSTVTLKGPQGGAVTLNVDPEDKKFYRVKVGHELVVQFTEAIAINVKRPR